MDGFLSCAEDFQSEVVQLIFAFVSFAFGIVAKIIIAQTNVNMFSLCFLLRILWIQVLHCI